MVSSWIYRTITVTVGLIAFAIIVSSPSVAINAAASEPTSSIKLTPFDISFMREDFDVFGIEHGVILLEENESTKLRLKINNHDDTTHEIQFHLEVAEGVESAKDLFSVEIMPRTITLEPNSSEEAVLLIKAENTKRETVSARIGVAASSTTFGATGDYFYLIIGEDPQEYDLSVDGVMRLAAPGEVTSYITMNVKMEDIENVFGHKIVYPAYLPENYSLRDVDYRDDYVRLVYSPTEITSDTSWFEFLTQGGMLIIYYDQPIFLGSRPLGSFNDQLLHWASYGAQQVKISDFVGIARDQANVRVSGSDAIFKEPAVLILYKDNFSLYLKGDVPLSELLKVAASVDWDPKTSLSDLKLVGKSLLVPFEEGILNCCHALDISPDGNTIAYSTATYDNQTQEWIGYLWLYDLNKGTRKQLDLGKIETIVNIRFSPDGDKLLFLADTCQGICIFSLAQNKLDVINLDGVDSADWMLDGSIVLSEVSKGNHTVSIYDGKVLKELYRHESLALIYSVRASPDGNYVAFVLDRPMSIREIYILNVETGEVSKVVGNEFRPLQLRWSPDGKYLIYVQGLMPRPPDTDFQESNPLSLINIVNVGTRETTTIVTSPIAMAVYEIAISSDSKKIIYALDGLASFPYVPPTQEPGIYVAELNKVIPEFPVNLMVIAAMALIGALIAYNLVAKSNISHL